MTKIAVVIVAAGRGSRARVAGEPDRGPKQYRKIGGRAIIAQTLAAFAEIPEVSVIQPVIHADDHNMYDEALSALSAQERSPILPPVNGGETRQASVYEGL
ncbi:MAG: 2-C-methyl-D-erythritol 4-phosphate cytidylyltransferase, partial [Pseudomonadota bacterium]